MNDPGHTPGIQPSESLVSDQDEIDVGFSRRHIGPGQDEIAHMLATVGATSLSQLMDETVPPAIRDAVLALPAALSEKDATEQLRAIADQNEVYTSLIGCGYHGTITPPVLRRNLLENPAWYTAYTPYQAEISQGRLDALLTFQTMVADLAGLDIANASLLDEGTAAAEAMAMLLRMDRTDRRVFLVDQDCHPQTVAVVQSRAEPIGIEVRLVDRAAPMGDDAFGLLVQYPGTTGEAYDLSPVIEAAHQSGVRVAVAADLLALVLLKSPGSCGADLVVGSTQRFGLPMWGGGPHAGFIAAPESAQRVLPGRVVGVSVDAEGRPALRLALQTREQHIRRERATSNICTAQVLPAVMAAMYACYHGPEGLQAIAARVHSLTAATAGALVGAGWVLEHDQWFDTLTLVTEGRADELVAAAADERINVRRIDPNRIGVSFDETTDERVLTRLLRAWDISVDTLGPAASPVPDALLRTGSLLDYAPFHGLRSETEMMRYLRRMADKDVALDRSMIPLGSCTMKLNAASEMEPVSWAEFAHIHPFAPAPQRAGYRQLVTELQEALAEITGYAAVSIQPNAGSQGELAGLLAIRGWHHSRDETQRDVCLIPSSAHGTNAASAVMAGMRVVVVACRENGDVDLDDLRARIKEHNAELAALMITYPSTHGVFEQDITDICAAVHDAGGQVYLDGANLNALVGLARPGRFGADVSHLNLHKTFCIPHGGGGPGVGPVAVGEHLVPFMPSHPQFEIDQTATQGPTISAAPWGSAGILPIPWMYITMMGATGLQRATEVAILSANYIATRLDGVFPVLYRGANGRVAHECVVDLRPLREETGVTVDDVAKRLIDYGFHAPTMSFPVAGTLMIEPTESENLAEINRFCDAMISIAAETQRIASGEWPADNNPLVNAPHTAEAVTADEWDRPYTRTEAAWPASGGNAAKIWPPVARIDGGFGDRNLVCSCPPLEELAAASMGATQ